MFVFFFVLPLLTKEVAEFPVIDKPKSENSLDFYLCVSIFCFREFAGLSMTAKELGLGEHVIIKLNRGSRVSGRQERYSIETDSQLQLEMPSILSGVDKLLCEYYP